MHVVGRRVVRAGRLVGVGGPVLGQELVDRLLRQGPDEHAVGARSHVDPERTLEEEREGDLVENGPTNSLSYHRSCLSLLEVAAASSS